MRSRLLITYIVIILFVSGFSGYYFLNKTKDFFTEEYQLTLHDECLLLTQILNEKLAQNIDSQQLIDLLRRYDSLLDLRITIISESGQVLADSRLNAGNLENHSDRKEFTEALTNEYGMDTRYSHSSQIRYIYVAMAIDVEGSKQIVRVAKEVLDIHLSIKDIINYSLNGIIICGAVAFLFAFLFSKQFTEPIYELTANLNQVTKGDFNKEIKISNVEPLDKLAKAFNTMTSELRSAAERTAYLEKMRSDFVSNVTHELKTPLTSIMGFVDTLKSGAIEDKTVAHRFLDIINIESNRLHRLIEDILSLQEIESREQDINIEHCNVGEMMQSVYDILENNATEKEIDLLIHIEKDLPALYCNRDRIKQMLINVVENAIKYTEKGTVKLSCYREESAIRFIIADTGIGIEETYLSRIFERFYRVDQGRSRKMGGTGLGLSIVKHIVQLYKGTITVESRLGKGTTFTIVLPLGML